MKVISIKIWLPLIIVVLAIAGLAIYFNWPKEKQFPEIVVPQSETPEIPEDWKTYRNEEYGFEFRYPEDWLFEVSPGGNDIHLSNFQSSSKPFFCDTGFIGLEIQAGHPKDPNQDFSLFVKSQLVESGLGPQGSLEEIMIGSHPGFRVQYSGWVSGCVGPGYFIEQDKNRYIYVFTGAENLDEGNKMFNQIIYTFKFIE